MVVILKDPYIEAEVVREMEHRGDPSKVHTLKALLLERMRDIHHERTPDATNARHERPPAA